MWDGKVTIAIEWKPNDAFKQFKDTKANRSASTNLLRINNLILFGSDQQWLTVRMETIFRRQGQRFNEIVKC